MRADVVGQLATAATHGHDAIPNGGNVWAAWTLDLPVIIPIAIVGFFYARGLTRWKDRHRAHPWWRIACYYLGLATILLSIISPLDSLGAHHFFMHMIQHELIMLVGIPLALLGAPTTPVLRGMPKMLRLGVVAGLAGDSVVRFVWRFITQPLIALVIYTLVLIAWHLAPGWYNASVENQYIHYLQHVSFAASAFLFWWNVIDPAPLKAPMGYLVRIIYVIIAATAQSAIAALLTFADQPLYSVYLHARPIFDLSPVSDQELGGLIMWIPGQAVHLVVIAGLFFVWAVQSERRQRALEAAADAAELERRRNATTNLVTDA